MRIHFICKRHYTNKDLLKEQFGRLYHLPVQLVHMGAQVGVDALDYRSSDIEEVCRENVVFHSIPATPVKLLSVPGSLYCRAVTANPDIIVASGDSHIGYLAMQIAKKLGVRFVFDVYDYYPAFGGNKIPGMKTLFRRAVEGANLVLCASRPLMKSLRSLNSNQLLVENGVDLEHFCPSDMVTARKELGLDVNHQYIGYFGSIDRDRGPLLIEACRMLRGEFPLLYLLLAGRMKEIEIDEAWITYFGELPQSELPRLINACNIVAVPYAKSEFNNMSGACKIAEYLACEKPVVATRVSDHEQIFRKAPQSLCEPTSFSLAGAIRQQLENAEVIAFPVELSWDHIGLNLFESLQECSGIRLIGTKEV